MAAEWSTAEQRADPDFSCTEDPVVSRCSCDKMNGRFHTSNRCAGLPFCSYWNALTAQQWGTFVFITTDKMHDYNSKGIRDKKKRQALSMSLVISHMLKCWPNLGEQELFVKLPSKIILHPASNKQIKQILPDLDFYSLFFFLVRISVSSNLAKCKLLMSIWNSSHLWLSFCNP